VAKMGIQDEWHIDSAGTRSVSLSETNSMKRSSNFLALVGSPKTSYQDSNFAIPISSAYHIGDSPDDRSVATCKKFLGTKTKNFD
jgi:hypothetical protein